MLPNSQTIADYFLTKKEACDETAATSIISQQKHNDSLFDDIESNSGDVQVMDINERIESEREEALDEEFKKQADNLDKARNLLSSRM